MDVAGDGVGTAVHGRETGEAGVLVGEHRGHGAEDVRLPAGRPVAGDVRLDPGDSRFLQLGEAALALGLLGEVGGEVGPRGAIVSGAGTLEPLVAVHEIVGLLAGDGALVARGNDAIRKGH